MIPIKRTSDVKISDLTTFINDYFRLIVTEINYNLRTKHFEIYHDKVPKNLSDGSLGYFPCRPADIKSGRPVKDEDPGLGQGIYVYLLDWLVVPPVPIGTWERPGKWYKINTTPVP